MFKTSFVRCFSIIILFADECSQEPEGFQEDVHYTSCSTTKSGTGYRASPDGKVREKLSSKSFSQAVRTLKSRPSAEPVVRLPPLEL